MPRGLERDMDNANEINEDNEVKDIVPKKTDLFFKEGLRSVDKPQVYSLDVEFAKTKKKKNVLFYFAVIAFIAALIYITTLITNEIQMRTDKFKVSIDDFKDLNLSDLLNTAKRHEARLRVLRQDLLDFQQEMTSRILKIKDRIAKEKDLLYTKKMSGNRRAEKLKQLRKKEEMQIKWVRNNYKGRIRRKTNEINHIKKSMEKYDKRLMKNAKRTEVLIDNYQKLHDLEIQKTIRRFRGKIAEVKRKTARDIKDLKIFQKKFIKSLVLKYNPVYKDEKLKKIIKNMDYVKGAGLLSLKSYSQLLKKEKILSELLFENIQARMKDHHLLITRMMNVDYTNSINPSVKQMEYLSRTVFNQYENLREKMIHVIDKKNKLIRSYVLALDYFSKASREHGYVINGEDHNKIILVLNDDYPAKNGSIGVVIRGDKRKIATLEFFTTDEGIRAKVLQISSTNKILPFDKVLIKLK